MTLVREIAWYQVGEGTKRMLSFAVTLAIARVLQPDAYGAFTLVFSTYSLIRAVTEVGVRKVVLTHLPGRFGHEDAAAVRELLSFSLGAALASALLTLGLGGLGAAWFAPSGFAWISLIGPMSWLALASIPLALVTAVLEARRAAASVSRLEITAIALRLAWVAASLAAGGDLAAVVTAFVGAEALAGLWAIARYRRLEGELGLPPLSAFFAGCRWARVVELARFGVLSTVAKRVEGSALNLVLLAVGVILSATEAGLLRVAVSLMGIPQLLLGAVTRALYPRLAERTSPREPTDGTATILRIGGWSVLVLLPILLGFALVLPRFVALAYGAAYAPSVSAARLLLPAVLFGGFTFAMESWYLIGNRLHWLLWRCVAVVAVATAATALLSRPFGLLGGAAAILASSFASVAVDAVALRARAVRSRISVRDES